MRWRQIGVHSNSGGIDALNNVRHENDVVVVVF